MSPARMALAVLGSVLLLAAALKADALIADGAVGPGLLSVGWLAIVVIVVEATAGTYLLVGGRHKAAWWVALACFSLFAGASAAQAIDGAASCACFGRWSVNPWIMASLDGLVVVILVTVTLYNSQSPAWRTLLANGGAITALTLAGGIGGQLALAAKSGGKATGLVPSVAELDLGRIAPNARREETLDLINNGPAPVEVAKVVTSCRCLKASIKDRIVYPRQRIALHLSLELGEETFKGRLRIGVVGYEQNGAEAFSVAILVTVTDRAS